MLTKRQLEDAAKCPQNGLCTKCEMDCVRTLYNGYFDGCVSEAAQTALAYREMLERARKTLQDAWEDEGSTTVGKQILETIKAIDELLKGGKMRGDISHRGRKGNFLPGEKEESWKTAIREKEAAKQKQKRMQQPKA